VLNTIKHQPYLRHSLIGNLSQLLRITFIRYAQNYRIGKPRITFIRYAQNYRIGKANKLKVFGPKQDCQQLAKVTYEAV
jgi:hypothetical protein